MTSEPKSLGTTETLGEALEREHHEIDGGIEAFLATLSDGRVDVEPLARASAALRRHIYLEEEFVFPQLRAAGLFAALMVMFREHGDIWSTLDALDDAVAADPASAQVSDLCATLALQLDGHNAKEEPIIYPHVDSALDSAAELALREFLATGTMPTGWVCKKAA